MRRRTTKTKRRKQEKVLEVRVISPRIAWHGFTKMLGGFVKLSLVLAIIGCIGWGIWRGIQHTFHHNPDFRLQVIDLNANPVIDEAGLIKIADIDLTVETSLFEVDVLETRNRLEAMPAVIEAKVERHLPGTLVVHIVSREPRAWVALTGSDLSEVRMENGLLIDDHGYLYPCPARQLESSIELPIILLTKHEEYPLVADQILKHPELDRCVGLLGAAREADAESTKWIESIRQSNEWALRLVTRGGTSATFGLRDHPAQMDKLRAALDHAGQKGYVIDTINLIPRFNVPITVRGQKRPPRAIPVLVSPPPNR